MGASRIATGHYARMGLLNPSARWQRQPTCDESAPICELLSDSNASPVGIPLEFTEKTPKVAQLLAGVDAGKDQTYFLSGVRPSALRQVLS